MCSNCVGHCFNKEVYNTLILVVIIMSIYKSIYPIYNIFHIQDINSSLYNISSGDNGNKIRLISIEIYCVYIYIGLSLWRQSSRLIGAFRYHLVSDCHGAIYFLMTGTSNACSLSLAQVVRRSKEKVVDAIGAQTTKHVGKRTHFISYYGQLFF